tara:strand:- start:194 stop:1171 length:978 start_codon:yes stop_codon:yes gene_type:complete
VKRIGQHIVDFISRFRSDVYLDDISTGTIASGGNLGLDSNNKIVKNTVGGGGTTDLTSDVSGVLPVANGGTGQNALSNVSISSFNNDSGFTANIGDVTAVKLVTDSGNADCIGSSGNLTFNILGGEGVDVTNSGTTITVAGEEASTSNKGVASFNTEDFSVSSGAVSLAQQKRMRFVSANMKGPHGTSETFIPLSGVPDEKTGFTNEQVVLLMPTGGHVREIMIRAHYGTYTSENITIKVYTRPGNKKMNGSGQVGSDITVAAPTQNGTDDNNTRKTGDLGTSYPFNQNDSLGISFTWASTGPTANSDKTYITVVLEEDLTDLGY